MGVGDKIIKLEKRKNQTHNLQTHIGKSEHAEKSLKNHEPTMLARVLEIRVRETFEIDE